MEKAKPSHPALARSTTSIFSGKVEVARRFKEKTRELGGSSKFTGTKARLRWATQTTIGLNEKSTISA